MGGEWTKATLALVSSPPQYGAIAKGGNEHGGPLFIRQTDIVSGRIDWASVPRCDLAAEDVPKYSVRKGDVLVSRLGAGVGNAAVVAETRGAVFAGYLVRFQPNPTVADARFVGYQLQSRAWRAHVHGFRSGAAQPTLNAQQMGAFEFDLPPLAEQRAIAHILGTLDDKIELNRRMNETLEEMARALFKSWFVDFDPVRAKAEGREPSGMDAETAKLFPSEFEITEHGRVPKGWSLVSLQDVVELNPPRRIPKGACAPYVEMAALPTSGHRPSRWPLRKAGSGARFENGDTLFARITPCLENGKTGYVDFLEQGQVGWGSTEYIVIRPRPPFAAEWGYLLARDDRFREFAVQKLEGTTGRQRVSTASLGRYLVALPTPAIGKRFGSLVAPLFRNMGANHDENTTLATIRDALLPRLLSGELSVCGAEYFAEMFA